MTPPGAGDTFARIQVRLLQNHAEYLEAERFQELVWQFAPRELIPLNELVVAQRNGGFVFGAFDPRGAMVGFCFGVPGFKSGKTYHYSRMCGVAPGYQDQGLGKTLKRYQRRLVLEQGLDLVKWTFDPLQSRNGFFNVEKLGVIVREYVSNIYAQSSSRFNQGLDTDRFVPEWWVKTDRVAERLERDSPGLAVADLVGGRIGAAAVTSKVDARGVPLPDGTENYRRGEPIVVEIPPDIDGLKAIDLEVAKRWREVTRGAFGRAFEKGYAVTGFASGVVGDRRRSGYRLEVV